MTLPFEQKKSLIFIIALLAIIALSINTHLKNKSVRKTEKAIEAAQEILYLSEHVLYSVEHIVLNTRGYILTSDPTFLKPLTASRVSILKDINSLKNLTKKGDQHLKIDTLTHLVEQRIVFSRRFIEARKLNTLSEDERALRVSRGERLMAEVRNNVSRIQVAEKKNLLSLQLAHSESLDSFNYSLLFLLTIIIGLLTVVFLSNRDSARLKAAAEQEVRENNAFLEAILNTIGDGVAVVNKEGEFVLFNPAAEKMLDLSSTNVSRDNWPAACGLLDPISLSPIESSKTPLSQALQGNETEQMELFLQNQKLPEGLFISISGRPIKTGDKDVTGALAVFHDITERKKQQDEILQLNKQLEEKVIERTSELSLALENLKRNEELLQETGKMAKIGGWEIEPEAMSLKWTDELFDIHEVELGKTPDVQSAIDFYAPEARPIITEVFQNCVSAGTEWEIDLPVITAKGKHIWVRSNGRAELKDNKIIRVYGALQEITERKKEEQERIKMIDALLVKNTDLEEFTYIVSHNLRAPLANIKGLASLIATDDVDDEI
ncbi:MAG TPA: CHASE3 domain-containing protein [Pedobacter sp.]|jgi:PAS domain S-box-containing protein